MDLLGLLGGSDLAGSDGPVAYVLCQRGDHWIEDVGKGTMGWLAGGRGRKSETYQTGS